MALVPHGPYDQYKDIPGTPDPAIAPLISAVRTAPKDGSVVNVLFFGLIRPYKGLEDLLQRLQRTTQGRGRAAVAHRGR